MDLSCTEQADLAIVTEPQQSYSLGPGQSRWTPSSWDDLVSAAVAGLLDETRWVELKKAVPASSRDANLELARDLASLAAEGGLLIVGIADNRGRAGNVVGTEALSALRARIDQVAQTTVHPPLVVSTAEIRDPSADDTGDRGCLLVAVPASPAAPHMVDHNYWGRGDTGKRRLDDVDVQHYFNERRLRTEHAASRLHTWVGSPSVRENTSTNGRVYVVAAPHGGRPDQLEGVLYRGDDTLPAAIRAAAHQVNAAGTTGLLISQATRYYRGDRHEGFTTDDQRDPGSVDERELVAVQVHEDGTVGAVHGQVTSEHPAAGRTIRMSIGREVLMQTLLLVANLGNHAGY